MRLQITPACENVKIEPVGMWRIVRRDLTPLMVASEDGKTIYEEGRDFNRVKCPALRTWADWTAEPTVGIPPKIMGPAIELTPDSHQKRPEAAGELFPRLPHLRRPGRNLHGRPQGLRVDGAPTRPTPSRCGMLPATS